MSTSQQQQTNTDTPQATVCSGGCHCGAVRFEATVNHTSGTQCNCSICAKIGVTATQVKPNQFKLIKGQDALSSYEFGGKIIKRYFCTTCGIHVYADGYLEVIGGDFVSIYLNVLDDYEPNEITIKHWDGWNNNWQAGMGDKPWPRKIPPTTATEKPTPAQQS